MKNINILLKEELKKERKRYLTESVLSIKKSKNENHAIKNTIYVVSSLMKEGYSFDEISKIITEQEQNIFTQFGDYFSKGLWGGAGSQIREWLLNWVLGKLFPGIDPQLRKSISVGLVDLQIKDLFNMFVSPDKCVPGAANIVDIALEVSVDYIVKQLGANNLVFDSLRNIMMDSVKQSNIGETIASNILCKKIHGTRSSQSQTTPPAQNNQTSTSSQPSGSISTQTGQTPSYSEPSTTNNPQTKNI